MKKVIIILFAITLSGCNQKYEKGDFLGTWEAVSVTDIATGEVGFTEVDYDKFVVDVTLDSIYTNDGDIYTWHIEGDSILLDSFSFYIKELIARKLILEYDFLRKTLMEFERRK